MATAKAGDGGKKTPSKQTKGTTSQGLQDSAKKVKTAQEKYIEELEIQNAILQSKLEEDDYTEEEISVSPTEYIKVMSLLPYRLNLCTKDKGQGNVYKFDKLFQTKRIIYSDLAGILESQRHFLENGSFVILNKKVIRLNGLEEYADLVLSKEKIEEILTGSSEGIALYSSANESQQLMIVDMLIEKMVQDVNQVDLNLVDKISRISKINISEKAEDSRRLLNPTQAIEEMED